MSGHGAVAVGVGLGHELFYVFKAYFCVTFGQRSIDLVGGQLAVAVGVYSLERIKRSSLLLRQVGPHLAGGDGLFI